jgi:hypothetical protein
VSKVASPPKQIFTEGSDDKFVVINTLLALHPEWKRSDNTVARVDVKDGPGWPGVLNSFALAAKNTGRFGLIVDADDDPQKKWRDVCDRLKRDGWVPPEVLPDEAWIDSKGDTSIGVWLFPNNRDAGNLETALTQMLPTDEPLWAHAHAASQSALRGHGAKFRESDLAKAALRSWLAWQEQPGVPPGDAIRRCWFDAKKSPISAGLAAWFERLFIELHP